MAETNKFSDYFKAPGSFFALSPVLGLHLFGFIVNTVLMAHKKRIIEFSLRKSDCHKHREKKRIWCVPVLGNKINKVTSIPMQHFQFHKVKL